MTWSSTCVITNSRGIGRFSITETKLYVPVVTLSTQDNAKLLQQLNLGFKRTISLNKYQSDSKTYEQNQYLNHLIDPSFQGVNRLTGQENDYTTGCLLDYPYFKENYKMIAKDLSKQQTLDDYRRAIQKIKSIVNILYNNLIFKSNIK